MYSWKSQPKVALLTDMEESTAVALHHIFSAVVRSAFLAFVLPQMGSLLEPRVLYCPKPSVFRSQ